VQAYRVYYGTASGRYLQGVGQGVNAGNVTSFSVTGLPAGTVYYFSVTSIDGSGNESTYSNEASKLIQ
jgi:hypothetical protein